MRLDDGKDVLWLSARFLDVDGTAEPGSFEYENHGTNAVAAIRLADSSNGDCLILEGPPADLVKHAREILRVAELIELGTMNNPRLRALYGITSPEAGDSRG